MSEQDSTGGSKERFGFSRRKFLAGSAVAAAVAAVDPFSMAPAGAASNTIAAENALQGVSSDEWAVYEDDRIEGFASPFSVNAGSAVTFKVQTKLAYQIDIYRIGWYGGDGARKITTLTPTPRVQPAPFRDDHVGLVDCGNWLVSATWNVPANAVSGVYMANFTATSDPSIQNYCEFVVRNDGRQADILFQTCDTTYQAYNGWGGSSLYLGISDYGRAVKVSYNRPLKPDAVENTFHYAEMPLVRWLERNGYDVTYCAGVDVHANGASQLGNRKIFLSQAHDEYWSGPQRTAVEAARDAGTNCIFMTGNEVFWKVRFENSSDGTNTPNRTMVCYKETLDNAKTDPSSEWTGTWRDPRFGGPGRPENGLTGTLFKAIDPNDAVDFAIEVPYAYSRLRLWRNTSIANLPVGQKATLSAATLGYEWNTDEPNAVRPPGLIRFSETTQTANQVLQDYGATYITAPLTHYLTQYRSTSGSLVFSTGSVQWSWGLDDTHKNTPDIDVPTDSRIQQATVNLLADMGVQPNTLQSGLIAASKSTDALPPVTTITGPAAGFSAPLGAPLTITGTSVDAGGGVVAGVEVSTDGGATWQAATGTASWSFVYAPIHTGPLTINVRGIDDSSNVESPGASVTINVGPRTFPCSIWPTTTVPKNPAVNDPFAIEVGVKFATSIDGFITGIRFYKGSGNTGTHTGALWSEVGQKLGTVTFANETVTGWQQALFTEPIAVTAGQTYIASYFAPNGNYAGDQSYFADGGYTLAPFTALSNTASGGNGVYNSGSSGFPASSYQGSNYWVDVVFDVDNHRAPIVLDLAPGAGLDAVALTSSVSAMFSEAMDPSTITMELRPTGGTPVAGSVSYDASTRTAKFTPSAPLAATTEYTAKLLTGKDTFDTPITAPVSWSFTTAAPPGSYPATLWDTSATPAALTTNDPHAIEAGIRFTSDAQVVAQAIRFYKGTTDSGVHTGHLWKADGTLLASVTFTSETRLGWQQADLSTPVPLDKSTVYIVSFHSTTGNGVATGGYFNDAYSRLPLRAASGDNGVFKYSATPAFPTDTWGQTNYWIDVLVARGADTLVPAVLDQSPAKGLQGVSLTPTLTAVFDDSIRASSLAFTLKAGPTSVPSTANYDDATFTASLTPNAALAAGTTYTASVSATDLSGNAMPTAFTWTFTTATATGQVPATIWDTSTTPVTVAVDDGSSVELGVKFRSDISGGVTGLRFYKGAGNNGPHVGHIWSADGTLLGSVTFSNETKSGWQQANLDAPVAIQANTTYVASYFAPTGHYSATSGGLTAATDRAPLHALADGTDGGNGVFAYGSGGFPSSTWGAGNYLVDVVFDAVLPVTMTGQTPAAGVTGVPVASTVTATFSQAITTGSAVIEVRDSGNAVVAGSTAYNAATKTATFTPTSALLNGATYTVKVSGATTASGAVLVPVQWSFTTVGTTPTGSAQTPAAGATKVNTLTTVSLVASQPLQAPSISFELRNAANALVAGTTAYDAATRKITFTPTAALAEGTTYTARLLAATSTLGVAMAPVTWTFSTIPVPVTIFAANATPASQVTSSAGTEVGMKFHSTVNGQIVGLRFYKGTNNSGTHLGHLWSSSGTLLATLTFTGETATGWQTARFSNPVNITANTTYVASYLAPVGRYSQTSSGFNNEQGTGQIRGNKSSLLNLNGVTRATTTGAFPNSGSLTANNFWVDVLFRAT